MAFVALGSSSRSLVRGFFPDEEKRDREKNEDKGKR